MKLGHVHQSFANATLVQCQVVKSLDVGMSKRTLCHSSKQYGNKKK